MTLQPRAVALLFFVLSVSVACANPLQPMREGAHLRPLKIDPRAEQVMVGIYPTKLYEISDETSSYYICAYLWLRWKGDIDPVKTLEFNNAIDEWSLTHEAVYEEPIKLADGSHYQIIRLEGRFLQPFNLVNYPLDRQFLTLALESTNWTSDRLVFIPDKGDSGYSSILNVPGWKMLGWQVQAYIRDYGTTFGQGAGDAGLYSRLEFKVYLARPMNFFIGKLLLPLMIVLAANWCVLLLGSDLIDVRTALPATSLLTLVFLQKSYSDNLPAIGSLMLMDKIYVVAYLVVIVTLAQVIFSAETARTSPALAKQNDRRCLIIQVVGFSLTVLTISLTAWYFGKP
jgi:hypothetical protein